ncbi:hypothetical protein LTR36_010937 [Oleoguttula mirabilis]|uniref:Uncharacterized protein n=1 Tax=Oleoguttula mirabilis TaxID=1507867 RepID=A0AAV9J3K9_9PEZI|nr:hypothetical protein LTR36_010937 [Oleoguttula mirabilis]
MPAPSSRPRQDSLLENLEQQKEDRRRRTSSSAKVYLDQLIKQTHEEPTYQPFLPPPQRRPSQQTATSGRKGSLPGARCETRLPSYVPPFLPATAPTPKHADIRVKRFFTQYIRCCNRTWLTSVTFAPSSSTGKAGEAPVISDSTTQTNSDDICYRCLDRLRWRSWRLFTMLGLRERLWRPMPKGKKVHFAYDVHAELGRVEARCEKFVVGCEDADGDEEGADGDDDEDDCAGGAWVDDGDASSSSSDETTGPGGHEWDADGEDEAAVEAARCLLRMA